MGRHRKVRTGRRIPLVVSATAVLAALGLVYGPHSSTHRAAASAPDGAAAGASHAIGTAAAGSLSGTAAAGPNATAPHASTVIERPPTRTEQVALGRGESAGTGRSVVPVTGPSAVPGGGFQSASPPPPAVPPGPHKQDLCLPYILCQVIDRLVSSAA